MLALLKAWFVFCCVASFGVLDLCFTFLFVVSQVALLICAGEPSRSFPVRKVTSSCPMLCCKTFLSSMVHATITRVGSRLGLEADCASGSWTRTAEVSITSGQGHDAD